MSMPDMISRAATAAADLTSRLPDLDLDAPSTCAEWDVRGLVNHITGFLPYSANAARKGAAMEGDAPDFAADPNWPATYATMAQDLTAAWSADGALDGTVTFGPGEMPAPAAAGITLMELTLHAWDLAQSAVVEFQTDEDIAAAVLGIVEGAQAQGPSDFFHEPVEAPADATTLERAAALSGRNPR
ncbi:MAG TPA: TIGR03086 family metal-binding protein [Acidimicrobiia bacterium]|jgi:uncharacterized protein (TIGR03086 family)|nr:TIGR03086 family metal-binding protein [Acidimicrobiia bacterium]